MNSNLKLITLIAYLVIGISTNCISQQTVTLSNLDTVKTIAIYSSKNSFFKDYPITTLVSFLNSVNTNNNIKYYNGIGDKIDLGTSADYMIDLNVLLQQPTLKTPNRSQKKIIRETQSDATKTDGTKMVWKVDERAGFAPDIHSSIGTAKRGEIQIQIIDKGNPQNIKTDFLSATNEKDQDLKVVLIIKLVDLILDRFSK